MIKNLGDVKPNIDGDVFVADTASVVGNVEIDEGVSIWYGTVIRGDIEKITIGKYSNIQDNTTVHTRKGIPTKIGNYAVVGHNVVLHSCTIGDNCLIGMGAIILNGATIGDNCIIAAGSIITEGKDIPANSLVMGIPGKVIRTVTQKEIEGIKKNAISYNELSKKHI